MPEASAVIQPELSVDDQERVPPPVLDTVMYCVGGLAAPWTVVKVRLVGLTPITGEVELLEVEVLEVEVLEVELLEVELATTTVIGTVFVVAPLAVIVTIAL